MCRQLLDIPTYLVFYLPHIRYFLFGFLFFILVFFIFGKRRNGQAGKSNQGIQNFQSIFHKYLTILVINNDPKDRKNIHRFTIGQVHFETTDLITFAIFHLIARLEQTELKIRHLQMIGGKLNRNSSQCGIFGGLVLLVMVVFQSGNASSRMLGKQTRWLSNGVLEVHGMHFISMRHNRPWFGRIQKLSPSFVKYRKDSPTRCFRNVFHIATIK
mmetsp:Transcript_17284/g.35807  ORF Transcript_17284/g.35807 Transcript_17284/m.35807 type:complete len:214 (-) Transcript_17284:428-1069(-)